MEEAIGSHGERPLVLVVDDAEDLQEMLGMFLESAGFRVAFARNGYEGLHKVVEMSPDVILMDLNMPGMDGTETTHHLKRQAPTKNIPILAFTGETVVLDLERIQRRGFEDVLLKTSEPEELVRKIREALRRSSSPQREGQ
jgi:CheY-like chemotaxis protein